MSSTSHGETLSPSTDQIHIEVDSRKRDTVTAMMFTEPDEIAPGWTALSPRVLRDALVAFRAGEPVIVGHADRASVVLGAASSDSAGTAALIRHGSGLVYVATPAQRLRSLQIPPMPIEFDSKCPHAHVAVDAASGIGTGISAVDRAETIRRLGDPAARSTDFVRPGHVVPVSAELTAGPSPSDADDALRLAWLADGHVAAAFTALISVDRPSELADRAEAGQLARSLGLSFVGSEVLGRAFHRRAHRR